MNIEIKSRWDGAVRWSGEATDLRAAVVAAVKARAKLGGAYLGGADLGGAYLRGADLGGAYLGGAYLGGAYLRGAYLGGADLGGAYLRGADLGGAYLRGADLRGAYLRGAKINWQSHTLIAHLLFVAAEDDVERRAFAGLIGVSLDWCWERFCDLRPKYPNVTTWALDVLAAAVVDGDGAPDVLRVRAAELAATKRNEARAEAL